MIHDSNEVKLKFGTIAVGRIADTSTNFTSWFNVNAILTEITYQLSNSLKLSFCCWTLAENCSFSGNLRKRYFVLATTLYRSGFLKRDRNNSPNSHQNIWRKNGLKTGSLLNRYFIKVPAPQKIQLRQRVSFRKQTW